jgi:hypothetical protein
VGALCVTLVRLLWSLVLIDLGALVQAAAHTTDGALARHGCGRQRAVAAAVARHAEAGAVVAVPMVGAVVQAGARVTVIARPARRAEAGAIVALAVSRALLTTNARATGCAVVAGIATIAVTLALTIRGHCIAVAHPVAGAVIGARALRAVQVGPALVALAGHVHAGSFVVARVHAGGSGTVDTRPARAAVARAVVAVAVAGAVGVAGLEGAVVTGESSEAFAGEVDALSGA